MPRRPFLTLFLTAWALLAASCLLTAPSDDELVGSCDDDKKNGGETDADCGGPCAPCGTGRTCTSGADCSTGVCALDVCAAPSCSDGVKNGDEGDIDCGGFDSNCDFCVDGRHCNVAYDCESDSCVDGVCAAPSCTDGSLNGDEADVDCGGTCPLKCASGLGCFEDIDCVSGVCDINSGLCQ
jgi:hypothetical protein